MKKTLLITPDFPPQVGGVATYLSKMCEHLDVNKLVVLADREKNSFIFDEQQSYSIIRSRLLYRWVWPRWLKTFFIAKKIIKEQGIEQILISHVIPMGYVAMLLNVPYFLIAHGFDIHLAQSNPWKSFWLKKILKKTKGLIVNSNYTKDLVINAGGSETKVTVSYPCPQFEDASISVKKVEEVKKAYDLERKRVVLTVGRLVERKGVDRVLEALAELVQKYPNVIYIIVGEGPYLQKLESLVRELQLENHVFFAGTIAGEELQALYSLTDVLVMPARAINEVDVEGFGIVFLEANLFGIPVIGGLSGGIPDAIVDGETGLLVDPNSVSDIQRAIDMVLSKPDFARKLGERGKARVLKEFTWRNQINKIKELLKV